MKRLTARAASKRSLLRKLLSYVVRPVALAAHDERERKNGDYRKMHRIELAKSLTLPLLEKANCARRFKEKPYLKKLGVRPNDLAAHDERARKNGYDHKMRCIELAKGLVDVVA